jgi:hypothetical protein
MERLKTWLSNLQDRLRSLSPHCQEAIRLQSKSLDQALTPWQRLGLRIHLILCKWCRRYTKQIRFLRQAAHDHPDRLTEASTHSLSAEARARIKRSLTDDNQSRPPS